MSFESGNTSIESIKENKLPPDVIELCSQLRISSEQMKKLSGLPPESLEPIFIQLKEYSEKMEQIPLHARSQYLELFTQETSVV